MYLVNEETLREEHRKQSGRKATGIDGVTKEEYGEQLNENLPDLMGRMKQFSVSAHLVFLRAQAASHTGHMAVATKDDLKSRMRENHRKYGSVRGNGIPSRVEY